MGRVLCAVGRLAGRPYCIRQFERNIYSAEELCYFLIQGAQVLNAEIMDPSLVTWLEDECALPELASDLRPYLGRERSLPEFVSCILEYVGFAAPEREEQAKQVLAGGQGAEGFARRMKHAQSLAGNAQLFAAIGEYDAILRDLPGPEKEIRSRALDQKGQAQAQLFQFRAAADSFEKAYRLTGSDRIYMKYLTALRLDLSDAEYLSFIAEHPEAGDASLRLEKDMDRCMQEYSSSRMQYTIDALRHYRSERLETNYEIALYQALQTIKDEYIGNKEQPWPMTNT